MSNLNPEKKIYEGNMGFKFLAGLRNWSHFISGMNPLGRIQPLNQDNIGKP
jgi:hypothetical protein